MKITSLSSHRILVLPSMLAILTGFAYSQPVVSSLTTLYSFAGTDGSTPNAGLTIGPDGNYYGTTFAGGGTNQFGTVFKITPSGALTTLHIFAGTDGSNPYGPLALGADGNFYGTTSNGGAPGGTGTVFQITPAGALTTLHTFTGPDGSYPFAGLTLAGNGNLYGVTSSGGVNGYGTVFGITTTGTLTTLYNFAGVDGSSPDAALTLGTDGNFYGTTANGGANSYYGTVFQITPAGSLTTLYSFGFTDGSGPIGSLTPGNGLFYGATSNGGANTQFGNVFSVTSTGALSILNSFSGANGAVPGAALAMGLDGNLYGTTVAGGSEPVYGTIFQLTPAGTLTTVHSFSAADGANPTASLTLASDGSFFGTTSGGGAGNGTIFRFVACPPCTTTSVISSANPAAYGTPVNLTATVAAAGGPYSPTGTVAFSDGGSPIGSVALTAGSAVLTTQTLSPGSHPITASYSGDAHFQSSSGTVVQVVSQETSTTSVVSSLSPSTYNQPVTFTAQVNPASATGSVTFMDGSNSLGAVPLTGGSASLTTAALSAGSHSISASYGGNSALLPSSATLPQSVNQASTSLSLTSGANPVGVGGQVTFAATITGQNGGYPTGAVTFSQNGSPVGSPVPLASGQAVVYLNFVAPGTFTISAVYSGDLNYQASNTSLVQTVTSSVQSPLTTLYSFAGPDGSSPSGPLTLGTDGNFYGTTQTGGANSQGSIFKISPAGALTTIYSFSGPDGAAPLSSLAFGSNGSLYGTTSIGGTTNNGTVFQITTAGALTTLYSFSGPDGSSPATGLLLGTDGNFYGTTSSGGSNGPYGTIFKITPAGTLTQLYSFQGSDGANPSAALTLGSDGNFYGSTVSGAANNNGGIFRITPGGALTPLYSFAGPDGSAPFGALTLGTDGNFYGTTSSGGTNALYGTVFKIAPTGALTTIYNFAGADGSGSKAGLYLGSDGNFYGTTTSGGANAQFGTIFSITPSGALNTLYSFAGPDGSNPAAALTLGADGNFYMTTASGAANGFGSVCRLAVTPAFTNMVISSSATPSSYGASVELTATISSPSNSVIPTGSVVFSDSGSPLATVPLTAGSAVFTTSSFSPGSQSISAAYSGDQNFKPSAGTFLQAISPANAVIGLVTSLNPSVYGQPVTFTANITPPQGAASPTGTVTFTDGATNLGTVTLSAGSASVTPTGLLPGTQSISVAYSGDANYLSGNAALSQVVTQAQSATKLVSSVGQPSYGQSVTFTASVSAVSAPGAPTGTVTFTNGAATLGVVPLTSGSASLTTSVLGPGTQSVAAVYSGDTNFQPSTGTTSETVGAAPTTMTVTSSQNPSSYNQAVTIYATVGTPAGTGPATGTVTFTKGSTTLGTGTLSGGVASFTTAPLSTGTQTIGAAFGGSSFYSSVTGSISQQVNVATPTIALTSSYNPSAVGVQLAFTAVLTGPFGGTPTGTVTFSENGTKIGSAVTLSAGKAVNYYTFSTAGTYTITAAYSGDSNFAGGSSSLSQVVTLYSTKTTVTSSASTSTIGNPVTFTATITQPQSKSIPNGEMVTFYNGSTSIGTGTTAGGVATLSTSALTTGTHSITATYAGDSTLQTSTSSAIEQVVKLNATTVTLSSSLNPSKYPQAVTFAVKVTSAGPTPTGNVTFKNGSTAIGAGTLSGGTASFTTQSLQSGSNSITVSYGGDSYNASGVSAALSQVVNAATTTTTIASSKNPSTKGTTVAFTATVTASGITPTGTVNFTYGSTTLGSATLSGGKASISTSVLPSGTDTVTATFVASTNFLGSSASLQQTVH
ncbi:choice-of-anchor tandem repeat GloVer-containing protein [Nevskia soli]|uniref:choice-of-anchor tandem repeat GloVer-containing protein n=1 Tax=Nevskia soli TaxID=418856 RepID=UPI0015D874AB|nr:choice-of-anchor tandem repeat GloVer-containing protein [Nevskia soli]